VAAFIETNLLKGGRKSYTVRWDWYDAKDERHEEQGTFRRWNEAEDFRKQADADALHGAITRKPERHGDRFQSYAEDWLERRLVKGRPLTPSTKIGYLRLLRRNVYPHFAKTPVRAITPGDIEKWYLDLTAAAGHDQTAKSYRLLHAILNTAAQKGVIPTRVNPCQIKGGGQENAGERPLVETSTVLALAEGIEDRYRAMVYLAGFGGLRTGEYLGLRRRDVNPARREVQVVVQAQELVGLSRHVSGPKSDAGKRTVAIPNVAMDALLWHLEHFTRPEPDAIVFTAPRGGPVRRDRLSAAWTRAKAKVRADHDPDLDVDLHLHDLRHHALTLAARKPGITTKELMARGGHSTPNVALRYQHAASKRDHEVADFLDDLIATATDDQTEADIVVLHR
jgi:integrase